jgi:hypothetical protein
MAIMSGLALVSGLFLEYFLFTRDWWHPLTITGTRVGIEDALYAIANGGLLAILAEVAFRRCLVPNAPHFSPALVTTPVACMVAIPPILVFAAGLHSFQATTLGVLTGLAFMVSLRRDLIVWSIVSAAGGVLLALPLFWIVESLFPGVVAAIWDLRELSGVIIGHAPLEDVVWYAYTGAFFGTYYKFATGKTVAPIDRALRSLRVEPER